MQISTSPKDPDSVSGISDAFCISEKCPFLWEDLEHVPEPLFLKFGNEILCVSGEYFKVFVERAMNAGKNIMDLPLGNVECKSNEKRSFQMSKKVWIESVLESKTLRKGFKDIYRCAIRRNTDVVFLKEYDKDLWSRVLFWVSDFYVFGKDKGARERLETPVSDERFCPFMTDFDFSQSEALFILGKFLMPNGQKLQDFIGASFVAELAERGSACTSHALAPHLCTGFFSENIL